MPLRLLNRKSREPSGAATPAAASTTPRKPRKGRNEFIGAEPTPLDEDELRRCLQQGRFGLIASQPDRWKDHGEVHAILAEANERIDEAFAIVPDGYAAIPLTLNDGPGGPEEDVETVAYVLGAVTNVQYQAFVDDGGYSDLKLWPGDVWPHLIDFVDQTGEAGPRYWRMGRHNRREGDHPVVGVSYYEAEAYAQWAGYRLPSEAEWQVAASWRIRSAANVLRRYPWGDALDTRRCNIWASGVAGTRPVGDYLEGASPNGVQQLVGNVWEWTSSDFTMADENGHPIVGDMLMKSVRGGAFDTYFPAQSTSCFRTGINCLARTHNVGIRCALDMRA